MIRGRVGYHGWTDMFGWSWTEASVLGSQAFGRALMEGCGLHKKIVKGPYRELEELPCTLFVQTY